MKNKTGCEINYYETALVTTIVNVYHVFLKLSTHLTLDKEPIRSHNYAESNSYVTPRIPMPNILHNKIQRLTDCESKEYTYKILYAHMYLEYSLS